MNPDVAASFTFESFSETTSESFGVKDAHDYILSAGTNPNLATIEWVTNHYRWIVWKLASMVRRFPDLVETHWNATKVKDQLLYR
jgi:hypothetical protein